MKSFYFSGPKFDIAVEMFCVVKFSNFLLGQKFAAVKSNECKDWSQEGQFCEGRPAPTSSHAKRHQHTSLSHYFEWKYV